MTKLFSMLHSRTSLTSGSHRGVCIHVCFLILSMIQSNHPLLAIFLKNTSFRHFYMDFTFETQHLHPSFMDSLWYAPLAMTSVGEWQNFDKPTIKKMYHTQWCTESILCFSYSNNQTLEHRQQDSFQKETMIHGLLKLWVQITKTSSTTFSSDVLEWGLPLRAEWTLLVFSKELWHCCLGEMRWSWTTQGSSNKTHYK